MNEIERKILTNQKAIMESLEANFTCHPNLIKSIMETEQLLSPKQTEEFACDMEENAKRGRGE